MVKFVDYWSACHGIYRPNSGAGCPFARQGPRLLAMTMAAAGTSGLSTDETIRQTVRALRSARQVDALVLARALGISRQSLYNRLNGAAPFLAAEIAGLAHFFGCTVQDIFDGVVRITPPQAGRDTDVDTRRYRPGYGPRHRHLMLVSEPGASYRSVPARYGSSGAGSAIVEHRSNGFASGRVNHADSA